MKKSVKRITAALTALVIAVTIITAVPFSAFASGAPDAQNLESSLLKVWADPENTLTQADVDTFNSGSDKTTMPGAVGIHKITSSSGYGGGSSSGTYYLFLPSNADCTNLKFWFATNTTVKIGNETLTSGQPTSALSAINAGGVSQSYTFSVGSTSYSVTAMKSGDVGAIYIDTTSGSINRINSSSDKSAYEAGTIMVTQPDGTVDYDGALEKMSGRGNATWEVTGKKPYNIKLAESTSLLGMNKAKKWCLIANDNGTDPSLLKDQIIYDFSDYIGIRYQVHTKPVDLYVNQQYYGSYQLAEKIQIKSNRINVTDAYENLKIANGTVNSQTGVLEPSDFSDTENSVSESNSGDVGQKEYSSSLKNPSDPTGGYIFELEISRRWVENTAGFCAYNGQGWVVKSCDYISTDMCNYCYDLLFALGGAVYNGGTVPSAQTSITHKAKSGIFSRNVTKTNPAPAQQYRGKKWNELLDANSTALFYWVQEYFQNLDASTTSNYFYKDSDSIDSKVYAGPIWDMDHAWYYNGSKSRWGNSCSDAKSWYVKNGAIYRWVPTDSTETYTAGTGTSNMVRTFLGALCYNCSDFWPLVERYWFTKIQPATQILLGNETDPTGKLKSVAQYAQTIEKSGKMNNVRHSVSAYDATSITSSLTSWVTTRNNWINGQITQKNISAATYDIPEPQPCTGFEIRPEIVLTYEGTTLTEGVDYDITYANNIAQSYDAEIILTGKGMFTGTSTITFTIDRGTLAGGTATINDGAYVGDTLKVTAKNSSGIEMGTYLRYQWKADGVDISGETSDEYIVRDGDQGKVITVEVKGDSTNISAAAITSNGCTVYQGTRPENFSRTIAEWKYDYTAVPEALVNADATGATYYYMATGGENAATSQLRASVNASSTAKIKWSGTADLYSNQKGTNATDQAPVMGTSKTDGLAWGQYPYFETEISTKGYENIKVSADIGGTKKGPSKWKLMYSFDGTNYTAVENTEYTITANKTMTEVFDKAELPSDCDDKSKVYIRMVVCEDAAINGINTIVGQTSGDAAINNIEITGASLSVITSLDAPTVSTDAIYGDGSSVFSTDRVIVTDNNGGADVMYSINGSVPQLYTEPFNPFDENSQCGDTATVTAFAQFGEITSQTTTYTVTYSGANINSFSYEKYPQNETNGIVFSTEGMYGESARMTAYTDGVSQYVPLWNDKNGAFAVSPDDGAKWSTDSGFRFELSTVGFSNIKFTCKAYTTNSGPKSASLQYSLDGTSWSTVQSNVALPAELGEYMSLASLPSECNNKKKVYIRLATTENQTYLGETLHNNNSKGNLYINNIIISGNENGEDKMPYTNKTSDYFGSGSIKYYDADGKQMHYAVRNENDNIILSGSYPESGIVISAAQGFNAKSKGPYTVSVWTGDGEDMSEINTRAYYYKGDEITEFKYSTKKPFESYVSADGFSASNTSGALAGTLSMYPNAVTAAAMTYTETYGAKVSFAADNRFVATKNLDNPNGNGYWLIETSSEGYTDLSLNLEQLSSNKGPRDWGVAYSTNGNTFTYVQNSNARAISNDAADTTVETYNNLPLPAACDNQEHLYIKVFINGGETVDGEELDDEIAVTKGNTGINGITLSGIAMPTDFTMTVNTVMLPNPEATTGSYPVDTTVSINGTNYTTDNGSIELTVSEGQSYTVVANSGKTFERTVTFVADSAQAALTIPVVAVDLNNDGVINAKDYAKIIKEKANERETYSQVFNNFLNIRETQFSYQ